MPFTTVFIFSHVVWRRKWVVTISITLQYVKTCECRQRNSMGTLTVSDTLKLNLQGSQRQSMEGGEADEEQEDQNLPSGTGRQAPKPEDLGNTRGKRMAMKFVNKIANKEKYTQVCLYTASLCAVLLTKPQWTIPKMLFSHALDCKSTCRE